MKSRILNEGIKHLSKDKKLNSLIKTGATGTNIADIQITVIK